MPPPPNPQCPPPPDLKTTFRHYPNLSTVTLRDMYPKREQHGTYEKMICEQICYVRLMSHIFRVLYFSISFLRVRFRTVFILLLFFYIFFAAAQKRTCFFLFLPSFSSKFGHDFVSHTSSIRVHTSNNQTIYRRYWINEVGGRFQVKEELCAHTTNEMHDFVMVFAQRPK